MFTFPTINIYRGITDQRSRRIPREYGKTKDPNRSSNSETDPGNHQGADHVVLDIGAAIRILQLNKANDGDNNNVYRAHWPGSAQHRLLCQLRYC